MSPGRIQITGNGQLFRSGEFLCNVTFTYIQIGNAEGGSVRKEGELQVEESKRKSPDVYRAIRHIPLELRLENGEIIEIVVSRVIGNIFDGTYLWVLWQPGNYSPK